MSLSAHGKGFPVLLLGAAGLGFAAIFVKWTVPAGPVVVGFYRMLFALPFILWMASRRENVPPEDRAGRGWAILGGFLLAMDLGLWHTALRWTSAANATMLVGLSPLWVALVSVAFFRARMRKRAWLGLALALGGALTLGWARGARLGIGAGEAMGALASFCYAAYTIVLTRARRSLDTLQALKWVVATGVVCFFIMALLRGESFHAGFTLRVWLSLLAIGILVQVGGWWLITWGMGHVPASLGSVGLLMQQAATVLLGWLLLREPMTALQFLATALMLIGIGLCATSPPVPRAQEA